MKTQVFGALGLLVVLGALVLPSDARQRSGPGGERKQACACSAEGAECLFGSAGGCEATCAFGQACDCRSARCSLGFPFRSRCRCL